MAWTTFATLAEGLQPFTLFDQQFNTLANYSIVPCTAGGTANAIVLTPLSSAPPLSSNYYTDYAQYSFIATATNSSTVTVKINFSNATALNLYQANGTTAITAGEIVSGTFYIVAYISTLNGNLGGFVIADGSSSALFPAQAANKVFAGPATGAAALPTFRSLVQADLPFGTGIDRSVLQGRTGLESVYTTTPTIVGLTVNANTSSLPGALPGGTVAQFANVNGTNTTLTADTFAATAVYLVRRANGTAAAPTALLTGNLIGGLHARGYGSTGYGTNAIGAISYVAAENWTDAAQGTYVTISTTPVGSNTLAEAVRIGGDKTVTISGLTSGGAILAAQAVAGTPTLTFPNASGTFAVSASAPLVLSATTGNLTITGSALTKADDTNVTLTLGGTPTTALLAAASLTLGWTGTLSVARGGTGLGSGTSGGIPYYSTTTTIASSALLVANAIVLGGGAGTTPASLGSLGTTTTVLHGNAAGAPTFAAVSLTTDVSGVLPLANGGTNANLTASNGGIFYSTASAGAILAGTATAGQMLRSGATAAPTWSTATFPATASGTGTILRADGTNWVATTATYPATTTINQLLYSSSASVIAGLATTNGGMLNASSSGVPSLTVTPVLGVAGTSTGTLTFSGITSGGAVITPQSAAGTPTLTLPNASGTFAVSATAPLVLSATTGNLTITGAALTKADDTNVTLTLGGTPATALLVAASITAGWTGQLSVARGGTGIASGTSGGVPYYSGTTTLASSALLTQNGPIYGGGAGNPPVAMAAGTDGQIIVGQTSAAPLWKTASTDLTISAAGAFTIANNVVTNAKLAQAAAYTLKGNATGSTANLTDFTIGGLTQKVSPGATDQILIVDVAASNALKYATVASVSAAGSVASIAGNTGAFTLSNGITNSTNDIRLATIATGNMLANTTGSTAVPVATALPKINQKIATFTTDATSTTATVYYYRAVGGGGGGGGCNGANAAAGGGAGGAYMEGTFSGVAASVSVTVSVGAGGTAGANTGGNGGNGGNTTISATGMTTVTAGGGGGGGGTTINAGSGGTGGTITAGSPLFSSAGSNGDSGETSAAPTGGHGASTPFGFGGAGGVVFNNGGQNAPGNGTGGGGGTSTTTTGGTGSAGACIITYVL